MSEQGGKPGTNAKPAGLMFNIGAFFGEVAKAVKTDVTAPLVIDQRTQAQSHVVATPLGPGTAVERTIEQVTLAPGVQGKPTELTARRTTVQEVTVRLEKPPGTAGAGDGQGGQPGERP